MEAISANTGDTTQNIPMEARPTFVSSKSSLKSSRNESTSKLGGLYSSRKTFTGARVPSLLPLSDTPLVNVCFSFKRLSAASAIPRFGSCQKTDFVLVGLTCRETECLQPREGGESNSTNKWGLSQRTGSWFMFNPNAKPAAGKQKHRVRSKQIPATCPGHLRAALQYWLFHANGSLPIVRFCKSPTGKLYGLTWKVEKINFVRKERRQGASKRRECGNAERTHQHGFQPPRKALTVLVQPVMG